MFYAQFVLSKKGPLAKIWLAAHWEKKLSKAQIYETNVQDAVDQILEPKVKMALRTTGHLLLGIVRIYSRKTKYLLADCNEAFLKIKMAFRGGQIEIIDEGRDTGNLTQLAPDVFTDFDTALPDFNDMEFANHLQINQSRIDDITLKEDLIGDQSIMRNNDFGMDDFGENAFGGAINRDEDFADFGNFSSSGIEAGRDSAIHMGDDFGREATPMLDNKNAPGGAIFNDDDFGAGAMDDDDMMDAGVPFNDNMSIAPLEAPGADMMDDLQLGAAANNLGGVPADQTSDSFALEPLESGAFDAKMQERRKKKRRLIFDEQKNIGGEEMKANMADYSDCLQQLDLAPPTRKLMKMKESGTVERLFHYPGCSAMKSKSLIRIYQNHLVMHARVDSETPKSGEVLSDLGLSDIIEDPYMYAGPPESNYGDDFDDCAPLDFEPIRVDSPPPMAELQSIQEESPSKDSDETLTTEKKKRKTNERLEEEEAVEGDEDLRWSKRTQGVLNSIVTKLKNTDEIALGDLLNKAATRKTAAQKFYTLLVLKKAQAIDVRQDAPYSDIMISAGPNIAQTAPQ